MVKVCKFKKKDYSLRLLHNPLGSSFYVSLYEVTLDIFKTPDRLTINDSTDVNLH